MFSVKNKTLLQLKWLFLILSYLKRIYKYLKQKVMKKIMLFILTGFFTFSLASAKDIITTDIEKLPQKSRTFLNTHFPKEKVSYIKIDDELLSTNYDVVLESGTEIEFLSNGDWKEVDTKLGTVPSGIIPTRIQEYINQNHKESTVKKIKRKKRTYEIKLSNRLELEFDSNGNFIRVDD